MGEPAAQDDIFPLWPTWVGQLQLPGAEEHNRALAELAAPPGVEGNLFETEHPAVSWLRGWIATAVGQWFEKMRVEPAPRWRLSGRLEALGFGQYRELGNEPGAYLAGLYFVNAPPPPELDHLRSDCAPSHVSFYDPRVGFNALALAGDPNFVENRTVAPVAGMLMLWPGYLRHTSRVHLARAPWVRVALRVELEGGR
ncbi:MAG TPA: hypothetical protein VMI15_07165 [Burkholderiales bacterium]|nr:hypothetical protein [Burkholderiales bacterium]